MKIKADVLLDQLINDGIKVALNAYDQLDDRQRTELGMQIGTEIWLQLDTYFDFE